MSQRLRWWVSGKAGAALVRGRRLDGRYGVRFSVHGRPTTELRFWPGTHEDTAVRLRAGGCYAFQVDGPNYSRVILFRAKAGPPFPRIARAVDALRTAGVPLEFSASYPDVDFGLCAQAYTAPVGRVDLYEFVDLEAARIAAGGISPSGGYVGAPEQGSIVEFLGTPHWFRAGAVLVLYVGSDNRMLDPLRQVLGPQFAGG